MAKQISLYFLILLLGVANIFAQEKNVSSNGTSLYQRALSACVIKELEEYGDQGQETRLRFSNRVVFQNAIFTDELPTKFGDVNVEYLEYETIVERYRMNRANKSKDRREEIFVTEISPMINQGTTLKISLREWWVSYKKKILNKALEGGCIVDFEFDTQLKDFVIKKTDTWGV